MRGDGTSTSRRNSSLGGYRCQYESFSVAIGERNSGTGEWQVETERSRDQVRGGGEVEKEKRHDDCSGQGRAADTMSRRTVVSSLTYDNSCDAVVLQGGVIQETDTA